MQNLQTKGFTLIELLVVIAIIGILAAAVVVSLGGATDSATDARDQATLAGIRPLTVLYISANGNSSKGICAATPFLTADSGVTGTQASIQNAIAGVFKSGTTLQYYLKIWHYNCIDNTDTATGLGEWAIYWRFSADETKLWCMDNDSNQIITTLADTKPAITTEGQCPTPSP